MTSKIKILSFLILLTLSVYPQNQVKIMSYNLLNYPGSDTTTRNPNFRIVVSSINPDILVAQEMVSQAGVNNFLSKVMNSFGQTYSAGVFIDSTDTDNAIFYKPSLFNFVSNLPIRTALRTINEFKLVYKATNDTFRVYSVHLKASSGSSNEILRAAEVDSLRKVTNNLPSNSNFIVVGDYNIYRYSESAFQKLLNQSSSGYFIDPLNLTGNWGNNSSFAQYHTQSTRREQLSDGGASGGMDDRFDMILISQAVMDSGRMQYVSGSTVNYGNDGLHFDSSVNVAPNLAVSQTIANALYYASDHLPVFASFSFTPTDTAITLNLTTLIEGFYNGVFMIPDTVKVYLRQAISPYAKVDSVKIRLDSSGNGINKFYNTPNNTYYLTITHRNSIETWSKAGGELITKGATLTYNFTTSSSQAYGNNMILKGTKWCIYSGDVNQDGFVNSTDLMFIDNDTFNCSFGYLPTDLTGDGFIDLNDLTICDNNFYNSIHTMRP